MLFFVLASLFTAVTFQTAFKEVRTGLFLTIEVGPAQQLLAIVVKRKYSIHRHI